MHQLTDLALSPGPAQEKGQVILAKISVCDWKGKGRAWYNLSREQHHHRENLITCERMNSLYWQNILVQSWKLYGWQNGTRQHYITLPGSAMSYVEHIQTRTFENHANVFAYLTNWPLYTLQNGFRGVIKHQGGPFLSFSQASSVLIVRINCQNGVPLKKSFEYCQLCNYEYGNINDPLTLH